jgi:uncharacterized protein YjbI with pentapeptide repeats
MIEIKHRYSGQILYTAPDAQDVRAAVCEAVAAKADLSGADLGGADLHGAYLGGADLRGAYLHGAYLHGAYLGGAYLHGADLRGADLHGAYLGGAGLGGAYLGGAYLGGADLHGAYLGGADLRGADLHGAYLGGANLHGADLRGAGVLHIDGLSSGSATLLAEHTGWRLKVGCWDGTTADLRELIAKDDGWPEASGEQIAVRRPMLAALADIADAWAAANQPILDQVIEMHAAKLAEAEAKAAEAAKAATS